VREGLPHGSLRGKSYASRQPSDVLSFYRP
jgi:hypothetical protein